MTSSGVVPLGKQAEAAFPELYQEYGGNNPPWTEDLVAVLPCAYCTAIDDGFVVERIIDSDITPAINHLTWLVREQNYNRDDIFRPFKHAGAVTAVLNHIFDQNPQIFGDSARIISLKLGE